MREVRMPVPVGGMRGPRGCVGLAVALTALLVIAAPAAFGALPTGALPRAALPTGVLPTGALHAQEPEAFRAPVNAVAAAWREANIQSLEPLLDPRGVRLSTPSTSHPQLTLRQVRSALEAVFEVSGNGPVTVRQRRFLGGEPMRGFAELDWRPRPPGMSDALQRTVYLGLERTPEGWRVVEIRILADPTSHP